MHESQNLTQAQQLAAKGIVGGKPLSEWLDAPHGTFAKAVREEVDPLFGLGLDAEPVMRKWKVRVHYSYTPPSDTDFASVTYEVEATTPEMAKEKAEECWEDGEGRIETGEDHEVTTIDMPQLLPKELE